MCGDAQGAGDKDWNSIPDFLEAHMDVSLALDAAAPLNERMFDAKVTVVASIMLSSTADLS